MERVDRLSGEFGTPPAQPPFAERSSHIAQSAIQTGGRAHHDESWIEVSSQPSSSSLSSVADEIITTGLRVQHDSNTRRPRPHGHRRKGLHIAHRSQSGGGSSSQEEYDESESESDRIMTSSNEGLQTSPLQHELHSHSAASSDHICDGDEEDDDDENVTAVNAIRGEAPHFQPQPNAFNRPASQQTDRPFYSRQTTTIDSPARPALRTGSQRHSYPAQRSAQHTPLGTMSPAYQADQDAALRASLSTLLSCAAAARGLSKPSTVGSGSAPAPSSTRVEPSSLRIVPESVMLGTSAPKDGAAATSSSQRRRHRSRSADKGKRTSASTTAAEASRHAAKKARRSATNPSSSTTGNFTGAFGGVDEVVSPTLLTWVVSAGVVVLVGALSFSAGYAVGRETGRAEAEAVMGGGSCGREMMVGRGSGGTLRRLRWTDGLTV